MRRLERSLTAVLLSGIPPILGLLAGWWGAVPLLPERWIWLAALGGLLAGFVVDALWLRRWLTRAESAAWRAWAIVGSLVYGFYAVGIYGFFMGVPVFIAGLAIPAAILVGCRLAREGKGTANLAHAVRRLAAFVTLMLALFCVASALLALTDASTAANLEGMFGLPFDVTPAMIWGLIVTGGLGLLGVQALLVTWLTRRVYAWTLRADVG